MLTAIIDPDKCIGCNRCVPVCPVDAITGANKYLHQVISSECIGCKLCVKPCPVDCIDIVPVTTPINKQERAKKAKTRHLNRQLRLQKQAPPALPQYNTASERADAIKDEIQLIMARVKNKDNVEQN